MITIASLADREYKAARPGEEFRKEVKVVWRAGSVNLVKKIADRESLASQASM